MITLDEATAGLIAFAPGEIAIQCDNATGAISILDPHPDQGPVRKKRSTVWFLLTRGELMHEEVLPRLPVGLVEGDLRVAVCVTDRPIGPAIANLSPHLRSSAAAAVGPLVTEFGAALCASGPYQELDRTVHLLLAAPATPSSEQAEARVRLEASALLRLERLLGSCSARTECDGTLWQARLTFLNCGLRPDVASAIVRARQTMDVAVRHAVADAEWRYRHETRLVDLTAKIANQMQWPLDRAVQEVLTVSDAMRDRADAGVESMTLHLKEYKP